MTISTMHASRMANYISDDALTSTTGAKAQDIENFTRRLMAGSNSAPEHLVINQLQQVQQSLMGGVREAAAVKGLSPEDALTAQAKLASSLTGVDMVAKVSGSFSTAINKLVSMQ